MPHRVSVVTDCMVCTEIEEMVTKIAESAYIHMYDKRVATRTHDNHYSYGSLERKGKA